MNVKSRILKDMRKDRVIKNYAEKHRLIAPGVYNELKARKKCSYCHKKFSGQIPEIHHKVPVRLGGTNDINNLMAVCTHCHKILDNDKSEVI